MKSILILITLATVMAGGNRLSQPQSSTIDYSQGPYSEEFSLTDMNALLFDSEPEDYSPPMDGYPLGFDYAHSLNGYKMKLKVINDQPVLTFRSGLLRSFGKEFVSDPSTGREILRSKWEKSHPSSSHQKSLAGHKLEYETVNGLYVQTFRAFGKKYVRDPFSGAEVLRSKWIKSDPSTYVEDTS